MKNEYRILIVDPFNNFKSVSDEIFTNKNAARKAAKAALKTSQEAFEKSETGYQYATAVINNITKQQMTFL